MSAKFWKGCAPVSATPGSPSKPVLDNDEPFHTNVCERLRGQFSVLSTTETFPTCPCGQYLYVSHRNRFEGVFLTVPPNTPHLLPVQFIRGLSGAHLHEHQQKHFENFRKRIASGWGMDNDGLEHSYGWDGKAMHSDGNLASPVDLVSTNRTGSSEHTIRSPVALPSVQPVLVNDVHISKQSSRSPHMLSSEDAVNTDLTAREPPHKEGTRGGLVKNYADGAPEFITVLSQDGTIVTSQHIRMDQPLPNPPTEPPSTRRFEHGEYDSSAVNLVHATESMRYQEKLSCQLRTQGVLAEHSYGLYEAESRKDPFLDPDRPPLKYERLRGLSWTTRTREEWDKDPERQLLSRQGGRILASKSSSQAMDGAKSSCEDSFDRAVRRINERKDGDMDELELQDLASHFADADAALRYRENTSSFGHLL